MIQVTMVPRSQVQNIWSSVRDYLDGAAQYTYGRYTVDDIYDAIMDYDHELWVAFDEHEVKGAVVTNFAHYPKKKYLVLVFCGGIELDTWKPAMLKLLQHYAFDTQCDGLESTGRPGWAKIFANDGHKAIWHTYELPAADAGLGA